jgi:hypothetical protein
MRGTVGGEVQAVVDALREQADRVAALPRILEDEARERTGELAVEVIHGSDAQWSAWSRYAQQTPPRAPLNLYPSLDVVRTIAPELAAAITGHAGRARFRVLVGSGAIASAADRDTLRHLVVAGADVRLSASVPSWAYIDSGVLAAVPLTWGEHPPTSIVVIRDAAISTALGALVEPLWAAAHPADAVLADPGDTLRLLALGLSDAAVAAAQSTSPRTVQRRIAEAMRRYGVTSRFELGVAWAAEQRESGQRPSNKRESGQRPSSQRSTSE